MPQTTETKRPYVPAGNPVVSLPAHVGGRPVCRARDLGIGDNSMPITPEDRAFLAAREQSQEATELRCPVCGRGPWKSPMSLLAHLRVHKKG